MSEDYDAIYANPANVVEWIKNKLGLPKDCHWQQLFGQMHVTCSHAHGYDTYIAAYKCDDKQGEIARLTVERDAALARAEAAEKEAAKFELWRIDNGLDKCDLYYKKGE